MAGDVNYSLSIIQITLLRTQHHLASHAWSAQYLSDGDDLISCPRIVSQHDLLAVNILNRSFAIIFIQRRGLKEGNSARFLISTFCISSRNFDRAVIHIGL